MRQQYPQDQVAGPVDLADRVGLAVDGCGHGDIPRFRYGRWAATAGTSPRQADDPADHASQRRGAIRGRRCRLHDASSGDEAWTILVGDDQRTVSTAEISDLYVSGTISMETSAWKEGMPDWLPISEIEALRSVLENGPRPTMTPLGDPANGAEGPASRRSIADAAPAAKTAGVIAARARTPEPAAVRRAGRGGAVDMFGAAAHEDVLTSASANPAAHAGEDKMTGARNENSVLFSLSALTGGDSKGGSSSSASKDEPISGKADLRALMGSSDNLGRQPAARSKLDDIMNLGGGGVYSPALMAPALSPPSVDFERRRRKRSVARSKSKSKTLI